MDAVVTRLEAAQKRLQSLTTPSYVDVATVLSNIAALEKAIDALERKPQQLATPAERPMQNGSTPSMPPATMDSDDFGMDSADEAELLNVPNSHNKRKSGEPHEVPSKKPRISP